MPTRPASIATPTPDDHPGSAAAPAAGNSAKGLIVAGDRPAEIVAFEESVVSFFIDAADLLGVPKSVAAIYGICFASHEPLSFSEINERLDISTGSISQGLRVLKEVGALKTEDGGRTTDGGRQTAEDGGRTTEDGSLTSDNGGQRTADGKRTTEDGSQTTDDGERTTDSRARSAAGHHGVRTFGAGSEHEATQSLSPSALQSLGRRKTDRYVPDLELRNLVLHWIESRLQTQLKSGQSRLDAIVSSIPASVSRDGVLETRFESLSTWHAKARSLLPVVKTFLKLT